MQFLHPPCLGWPHAHAASHRLRAVCEIRVCAVLLLSLGWRCFRLARFPGDKHLAIQNESRIECLFQIDCVIHIILQSE